MLSITSIAFDKPGYKLGDVITAAVNYTGNLVTVTFTASGAVSGNGTGSFLALPAWIVTDPANRTWTLKSDDGSQAIFTAVA